MKIRELVQENVHNIIVLQNIYATQRNISASIRNQLNIVKTLRPK
jgi:hypothetical protein